MNFAKSAAHATFALVFCVGVLPPKLMAQNLIPKGELRIRPNVDSIADPIQRSVWGKLKDGREVEIFTLTNELGLRVRIATYGALLVSVETPDANGDLADITLSYPDLAAAEKGGVNGNVVGRFANRIDTGGFTIDGTRYDLETVNQKTKVHIHGGKTGIHRQVWDAEPIKGDGYHGIRLSHTSPDGHEGFPGEVVFTVDYRLTENSLILDYRATTTKPTHLNLTNHAYFNLSGDPTQSIDDHVLELKAEKVLAIDDRKVPTGKILPVEGTPFDFRKPHLISETIGQIDVGGYDHCYVLNEQDSFDEPTLLGRIYHPKSGRFMEIESTQPGVQIYTANHYKDPKWPAICFETQHFPDSPNKPNFPSTLLRPGETLHEVTVFRFGMAPVVGEN